MKMVAIRISKGGGGGVNILIAQLVLMNDMRLVMILRH